MLTRPSTALLLILFSIQLFAQNPLIKGYVKSLSDKNEKELLSFATVQWLNTDVGVVAGRRFAFFKNAYIQYKIKDLKIQFGIADAFQFKTQENFWGYRYIFKSFQDQNKFGSSADIGMFVTYKFTNWISADYSINNGDGYGSLQIDDNLKNTFGVTLKPTGFLTLRGYWDIYAISDSNQMTAIFFAGLKFKPFSIGAEYVYQKNNGLNIGHDQSGFSVFTTYNINDKFKVFGRYDLMTSVEIDDGAGSVAPWSSRDGDLLIGGVEYVPNKNINISLNYQYQKFDKVSAEISSIYLSLQAKF